MANPLPNSTTTPNFRDTILSSGGPCQSGNVLIANNPAQIQLVTGPEQGTTRETTYPYIAPSIFPLAAGRDEFIYEVRFADFISGTHAQVSGWLIPVGLAGPVGGNPFTGVISATGTVLTATPQLITVGGSGAAQVITARQDIPGVTATFTVVGANASFIAEIMIDWECTVASAGSLWIAIPVLDGGDLSNSIYKPEATNRFTLADFCGGAVAPGTHTLKLQALRFAGAGTAQIAPGDCLMNITIIDK